MGDSRYPPAEIIQGRNADGVIKDAQATVRGDIRVTSRDATDILEQVVDALERLNEVASSIETFIAVFGNEASMMRSKPFTSTETFTEADTGRAVDVTQTPTQRYALSVVSAPAATAWDVHLEVSLNGVDYWPVIKHTEGRDSGNVLSSRGTVPAQYFRVRCVSVTLGPADKLHVTALALT